ncbi:MAG: LarC family nickel insertion protein [Gammaproteobacteria bacterium SHHR-1]|uniref:LarC family nickel insertion protein n=1 Tax=Magnetovirga frankeli TaxID=947516 RepID=UPI001292E935|nr:LarC family nickel insertion protein [gamma proteobacterium SS-5]
MHLHLNPIGGLAGDMFCAALLDLRPELFPSLRPLLMQLGPPAGLRIGLGQASGDLHGRHFLVRLEAQGQAPAGHAHSHYRQIKALLQGADLPAGVRQRGLDIFRLLAEAEAQVHGVAPDDVVFHELGNWDSIVDILCAAFLLEQLDIQTCSCGPLPLGAGRVNSQHGWLPLPAPATAYLLQGMELHQDGVPGERVTPTGAAILRALDPAPMPSGRLRGSGYGFGSRQLPGLPNCLQAQLLEGADGADGVGIYRPDQVLELVFELDDQGPEDLAIGLERIRCTPGVLSLLRLDAVGKQGRPCWQIQVLAEPVAAERVREACFRETRSLGLRHRLSQRWTLQRRSTWVGQADRLLGVKLSRGPDGWQAKTESRDLAAVAGQRQRRDLARQAEAEALSGLGTASSPHAVRGQKTDD